MLNVAGCTLCKDAFYNSVDMSPANKSSREALHNSHYYCHWTRS